MGNSQSTLTVRDLHNYKGVTYEIIRNTHYTIFIMTPRIKKKLFILCDKKWANFFVLSHDQLCVATTWTEKDQKILCSLFSVLTLHCQNKKTTIKWKQKIWKPRCSNSAKRKLDSLKVCTNFADWPTNPFTTVVFIIHISDKIVS